MNNHPTISGSRLRVPECNCLALRQAARHVSQFYDRYLMPTGLRTTQYSILAKLKAFGPITINTLAEVLIVDRTTLGRTILPLARDGLIVVKDSASDRRSKELQLTAAGAERLAAARKYWSQAQRHFEQAFGGVRASKLRGELHAVASSDLAAVAEQEA
jgi:DNA-binding MarR family transcriptional regulator